jgi:hypothetical protein
MKTLIKQPKNLGIKAQKKAYVINTLLQQVNAKQELYKGYYFITYIGNRGQNVCALWTYNSIKPTYHYSYRSTEEMQAWINEKKLSADREEQSKIASLSKYEKEKQAIQPGSILYSSWGYEQTNIDFYVVLERKNDFVIIQEVGQKRSFDDNFNDRGDCVANPEIKIGEPFRKKINKWGAISLNTYSYCGLWDGKPKGWSSYA